MTSIKLPTIESINNIGKFEIERLAKTGFCYIKVDGSIQDDLLRLGQATRDFFALPEDIKQSRAINDSHEGYLNHAVKGPEIGQRYVYKGSMPPQPLHNSQEAMERVRHYFINTIGLSLLKKIFNHENMAEQYRGIVDENSSTLSMIYYPDVKNKPEMGLRAHRDIPLLTMLYIKEDGLQVYYKDQWCDVHARPGYIVVNIGDALGVMTGGKYQSSYHRVANVVSGDRLSMASFLGPKFDLPLMDYVNNKLQGKTYKEFYEQKLKDFYGDLLD